MNSVTSSPSPFPCRLRGAEAVAAVRGTERAANCLATPFARLTPPTQVFPFPQTASPAANKDGGARPRRGQRGPFWRLRRGPLRPRRALGPLGDAQPSPLCLPVRTPATRADCKVVRNNYRVIDGGPDRCQVQVPFETAVCILRG